MDLNEFKDYLIAFREIQFLFMGKHYMASHFWVKRWFKKGYDEYWLYYLSEDPDKSQKFETLDELLNCKIEGKKLYEIVNGIKVEVIY